MKRTADEGVAEGEKPPVLLRGRADKKSSGLPVSPNHESNRSDKKREREKLFSHSATRKTTSRLL